MCVMEFLSHRTNSHELYRCFLLKYKLFKINRKITENTISYIRGQQINSRACICCEAPCCSHLCVWVSSAIYESGESSTAGHRHPSPAPSINSSNWCQGCTKITMNRENRAQLSWDVISSAKKYNILWWWIKCRQGKKGIEGNAKTDLTCSMTSTFSRKLLGWIQRLRIYSNTQMEMAADGTFLKHFDFIAATLSPYTCKGKH